MAPLLIDLSHTSHSAARSGVQRVVRGLWRELGHRAEPITFDPSERAWRRLQPWELSRLRHPPLAGRTRRARWPLSARLRGWWKRVAMGSGRFNPAAGQGSGVGGLIVPEIFSPEVGRQLPALRACVPGPRIALFHDALALRYPELSPASTVARFPGYLTELAAFDGIAAVSASSRDELLSYWRWAGIADAPPVEAIPLGVDRPSAIPPPASGSEPEVLCVSSVEGRKNHPALLSACEALWSDGLAFRVRLIGHPQRETGAGALSRIRELQAAGRPLEFQGSTDDAALEAAYASAAFTVYPSVAEGFGLPVAESLVRGRPCVCSFRGALGEIAALGGCLATDPPDPETLRAALRRLLTDPAELRRLTMAARRVAASGAIRTPADHARDLLGWMAELGAPGEQAGFAKGAGAR